MMLPPETRISDNRPALLTKVTLCAPALGRARLNMVPDKILRSVGVLSRVDVRKQVFRIWEFVFARSAVFSFLQTTLVGLFRRSTFTSPKSSSRLETPTP